MRGIISYSIAVVSMTLLFGLGRPMHAGAENFHGFDPEYADGTAFDPASHHAMVVDAMKKTPLQNGSQYVFGYTMWTASSTFANYNRLGLQAVAAAAGMKLIPDGGFTAMNTLLNWLDHSKPIFLVSFYDESLAGASRAIRVAGRQDTEMGVGMGGKRPDARASDPMFLATLSTAPTRYGDYANPAALTALAGYALPLHISIADKLVTATNICQIDNRYQLKSSLPAWQPRDLSVDSSAYAPFATLVLRSAGPAIV